MASSIGEVFDSAANTYTPPPWAHKGEHLRAPIERGAKAVLLYALDLMIAVGVDPWEAAARLREGKTIEDICAESSSYSARQICHADEAVLFPGSGPICTEPQGHEGAHVARDGSGRVVSSWASRG